MLNDHVCDTSCQPLLLLRSISPFVRTWFPIRLAQFLFFSLSLICALSRTRLWFTRWAGTASIILTLWRISAFMRHWIPAHESEKRAMRSTQTDADFARSVILWNRKRLSIKFDCEFRTRVNDGQTDRPTDRPLADTDRRSQCGRLLVHRLVCGGSAVRRSPSTYSANASSH